MVTYIPKIFILGLLLAFVSVGFSQSELWSQYESNIDHPYGQKNPEAPSQLDDFKPMIGTCDCRSLRRNPDGSWADTTNLVWTFKYVLNGTAIQDQTWSESAYASSIRQFQVDSSMWIVSYYSFPVIPYTPSVWHGKKANYSIVLDMPQKAPNGMDGTSRLSFFDISDKGFSWKGEWINEAFKVVYPFWQIWCKKRT